MRSVTPLFMVATPLALLCAGANADPPAVVTPGTPPPPGAEPNAPLVDPNAEKLLARMADYLRSLPAFRVRTDTSREEIVHGDFKIERASQATVTLEHPDRLRADVVGDNGGRTFVYDGKNVSVYTAPEDYAATTPAPATITQMLDTMLQRYGVEFPLLDVIYTAAGGNIAASFVEAGDIGPSRVGGVDCEHLAFRGPRADWQVWVQRGDRPLPLKIVVTTREAPLAPETTALLTWEVAPSFDPSVFRFTPPPGAKPIPFQPLAGTQPEAPKAAPPVNSKP